MMVELLELNHAWPVQRSANGQSLPWGALLAWLTFTELHCSLRLFLLRVVSVSRCQTCFLDRRHLLLLPFPFVLHAFPPIDLLHV